MPIALPQLSDNPASVPDLRRLILRDETISGVSAQEADVTGVQAKGLSANDSRFDRISMAQSRLEKSHFTDVELLGCDLTAAAMPEASWRRVLVQASRGSGLQLQTSQLKDITFVGCKIDIANFRFSKLINVCFTDCVLNEADFYGAALTDVQFQNCSLVQTVFSGSKLQRVDLRSSTISSILGIDSLAGAIIDSAQLVAIAPLLASAFKITVKDD
jgi:uncharacterized protein YjbI with pentapeptide repeats